MLDDNIRPAAYGRLLALSALLGILTALITFSFIAFVHEAQMLIWDHWAPTLGLPAAVITIAICSVAGLLVGLIARFLGDPPAIFAELMAEFGHTGRFNYRTSPVVVLAALPSLIGGGSLGPEAPLADACGSIGTWLSDKLKLDKRETTSMGFSGIAGMLAAFITSPWGGAVLGMESARSGISYIWMLFPSLVSSAMATVVFVALSGSFFANLYSFPGFTPAFSDLILAVPLGAVGAVAGAMFIILYHRLHALMAPLRSHVILRGLIGGLVMGVAGAVFPLVLFSGEYEMAELINEAATIGAATLVVMAVVKLAITTVCLATGWKGGYIFPIMFGGCALGLALHLVFPSIPIAVAVSATMSAGMVATMKAPIFSALFTMVLVGMETSPVIAIAVITSALLTWPLSMIEKPAPAASPSDTPAPA
jgi:H+/Cl- antiporter ClcA